MHDSITDTAPQEKEMIFPVNASSRLPGVAMAVQLVGCTICGEENVAIAHVGGIWFQVVETVSTAKRLATKKYSSCLLVLLNP